jgi:hypothetical protein
MEVFNLSGLYECQVTMNPSSGGDVQIHRTRIGDFSQLTEFGGSIWTGIYFNDIPIKMKAIPSEGFRFVRWEGVIQSQQSTITIQPDSSIHVSALFERKHSIPNPMITIVNEKPLLSFQMDLSDHQTSYHWEFSNDLAHWEKLETTIVSSEPIDKKMIVISSTLTEPEILEEPQFFRIGLSSP